MRSEDDPGPSFVVGVSVSDVAEIRKSILILRAQSKGIQGVETFLRNREWHIHSTTDLKAFLVHLVQHKPSFVMISIDHTNRKVKKLPKLLTQAFPVFVIAFAETAKTTTFKDLQDSGTPYRINPPLTGPAVERMVNKIIKDQEVEKVNQAQRASGGGDLAGGSGDERITVAGSADAASIAVQGGSGGSAADIIRRMMSDGGDSEHEHEGDSSAAPAVMVGGDGPSGKSPSHGSASGGGPLILGQSHPARREALILDPSARPEATEGPSLVGTMPGDAPSVMVAKGQRAQHHQATEEGLAPDMGPAGYIEGEDPGEESSARQVGVLAPSLSARSSGPESSQEGGYTPSGEADSDGSVAPAMNGGAWGQNKKRKSSSDSAAAPLPSYSEEDIEGLDRPSRAREETSAPPLVGRADEHKARGLDVREGFQSGKNSSENGPATKKESKTIVTGSRGWEKSESIIVRGTQRALDETVRVKEGHRDEDTQKVSSATNVACLIIESAKFSGYLVAALGKDRKVDEKFVNLIKDRLCRFLKESGEQVDSENSMSLKIKKVDFEDWALEYADFLRKSVHDGEEIAMAFFPFAEAKTEVGESASVDMGSVKIDELQGDVTVEFNLYIHLPSNNKYILYTPRNSTFYGNQKERLSKMGVTHMHVKRTELQDVSKYRAQNYLNSKIEEFQNRRRGRDPAPAA